jgi:hypothetical protein
MIIPVSFELAPRGPKRRLPVPAPAPHCVNLGQYERPLDVGPDLGLTIYH